MAMYCENAGNRILELLNGPLLDRLSDLSLLFDRCNLRELHDIFPTIVQSVFGIGTGCLGWGLRTTTKENSYVGFDVLMNFFQPMGPMFRLCYRLLNEGMKFEMRMDELPHKLVELLHSGQYSMFYADLINVDPFRRQVTSLCLNAFDYYMLHFAIYATLPLHRQYPAALQVHNERLKTVYFQLTAEYLQNFLPSHPDDIVLPHNICNNVKPPQPIPVQPLQPKKSPKYLKIPQSNQTLFGVGGTNMAQMGQRNAEQGTRVHTWRTESVLYFFVDTWLRYDASEARDLPSSEFIRVTRILIKQTHTFSNSAHLDQTTMAQLRKMVQSMVKPRIYPFLKSTIGRWPLDSSLSVVIELWLSYIQPWRYTCERQIVTGNNFAQPEVLIGNRFDTFIIDNLAIYTQIFLHVLPRFARLDFTSLRNVIMLHRLVKVFSQSVLPQKLFEAEKQQAGNAMAYESPRKHSSFLSASSSCLDWDSTQYRDEVYMPLFSPEMKVEIENFIRSAYISRMYVCQEIETAEKEQIQRRNSVSAFKRFFLRLIHNVNPWDTKLDEMRKIPPIMELAIRTLCQMFNIEIPIITMDQLQPVMERSFPQNFSMYDNSDYLDISQVTPMQMKHNLEHMIPTIDPATIPIQSNENKFLVRLLHQISCAINEKYGPDFQRAWDRRDFWGKIVRQLLYAPMAEQWFEKPRALSSVSGISELHEKQLPARLCLRFLASYRTMFYTSLAMLLGYLIWGSLSYGLFIFLCLIVVYVLIMAVVS